jgi:hypothetical protein
MFQVLDGALSDVGGGASGINYITNPDAEVNADGWNNYANTTPGVLPDDFLGSVSGSWSTIAASPSSPLRGSKSFIFGGINSGAGDLQGHGVYSSFTVDSADLAKKMTISFDYLLDDSALTNAVDGMLRVYIYDEDKSELIRVNGEDLQLNANSGTHYAQFQTDSVSTNYRLVIHQALQLNVAEDYTIRMDNVQVGPTVIAKGTIVTDAEDYTPVLNSNTNVSTNEATYTRIGDSVQIQGRLAYSGAGSATQLYVELPVGLSVDTNKLKFNTGGINSSVGFGTWLDNTTRWNTLSALINQTADKIYFAEEDASNLVLSSLFANGDEVSYNFSVPIQGWSSNAKMSEDLGGRDVVVEAEGGAVTTITAGVVNIPFIGTKDTTASWDGDEFTAPETADYIVSGMISQSVATSGAIQVFKNGTLFKWIEIPTSLRYKNFNTTLRLEKGETFSLRTNITFTNENSPESHYIRIQKLASPQTILENETVAATMFDDAGQSFVSTSQDDVVFTSVDFDTHNAYNTSTGEYTVVASGIYDVKAEVRTQDKASSPGEIQVIYMNINGSTKYANVEEFNGTNANDTSSIQLNYLVKLEKGDVVKIQYYQNTGTTASLVSSPLYNTFSIARIK